MYQIKRSMDIMEISFAISKKTLILVLADTEYILNQDKCIFG